MALRALSGSLTLIAVGGFLFSLYILWELRREPGARLWLLANLFAALGCLAVSLRGVLPDVLSIFAGNALWLFIPALVSHSLASFTGDRKRTGLAIEYALAGVAALLFLWLVWQEVDARTRILWFSAPFALLLLGPAWRALRKHEPEGRFWMAGLALLALSALSVARAAASFQEKPGADFFELGLSQIVFLSIFPVFWIGLLAGFAVLAHRRLATMLRLESAELREARDMRDQLFRWIAHDLRGPLGATAALLDQLREDSTELTEGADLASGPASAEILRRQTESLRAAACQARALYGTMNDLLSWSQARREGAGLQPEELSFAELLGAQLDLLRSAADAKGVRFTVAEELADERLYVDGATVQSILRNLLDNAIKFSHDGGIIEIRAERAGERARIAVRDYGVGFREPEAGEPSKSGTRGERGSGLGLLLCREYAQKNGGALRIFAPPGGGACAELELPLRRKALTNG